MGSVGQALDPTSNNFLGGVLPQPLTRLAGDVATGGLAEFGRPDSFGLPANIAGPLKIGAGTVGGAMLGGPAGAFLGGTLGGALGGNTAQGAIGGGIGGLIQSLIAGGGGGAGSGIDPARLALGGSLLGLGLSQNTDVGNPQFPNQGGDQGQVQNQSGRQAALADNSLLRQQLLGPVAQANQSLNTNNALTRQQELNQQGLTGQNGLNANFMNQLNGINSTQNDLLDQRMTSQRDQLLNQLTNGPEGEAFRQKYNNLGLLDSGAFNTGLANQFTNLAAQQQQDILNQGINQQNQLAGAAGQGFGSLSSLQGQGQQSLSGLQGQGLSGANNLISQGMQNQANAVQQGSDAQSQLGIAGLGRQFGLEDQQSQFNIAKAIQDAQAKQQLQSSLMGGGAYLLGGGGMNAAGNGGASGGSGGGGLSGLFGGNSSFLSQLGSGTGNFISDLLNKFRGGSTGGPMLPDSNLNLDPSLGGLRQPLF